MANTELLNRLRDLHKELAEINEEIISAEQIDDQTAAALGEIVQDVGNLVNRSHEVELASDESDENHSELQDRIVKFEVDHPQVTGFLAQISEILAMMGI